MPNSSTISTLGAKSTLTLRSMLCSAGAFHQVKGPDEVGSITWSMAFCNGYYGRKVIRCLMVSRARSTEI